ncbi:glycosyltransferase [Saccharothrix obliqua]|uniref:glycosyltransferase n=1 Tax=Saccharothrix obliqua TaxID=2861747 RepID=UPI001C5DF482|nr:glycosyltransferase [Saccharothrix obliqua]MBW4722149.1 glycosyltransferase [Saccharothrix obliqua]
MRALLVTHGTRGDVQPMLALAVALRRAGHEVLLAAPHSAGAMAAEHGVEFAGLDEGPNKLLHDPVLRQAIDGGYRGLRGKITAVRAARRIKPLMADVLRDVGDVARGSAADVVVHTPAVPAQHVAELLGVPAVLAALQPGWVPTAAFPCPMVPLPRLPKSLNRATYLAASATLRSYAGITDRWRVDQLGLPRRRGSHNLLHNRLVLQAFSPRITPVAPDWPTTVRTTGFWYLPDSPWTPPPHLEEFLSAGPPPVYLGFGSMAGRDTARTGRILTEAIRKAGVRAVLATGWGSITALPSTTDILVIDQAPHQWLFPRIRVVVHHGGAGTTAAALAAGVPQVVCPFVADQPHWAHRAHVVGIAPPPLSRQRLTATALAEAIATAVHDTAMRQHAHELGAAIRAEDGVTRAVAALEDLVH